MTSLQASARRRLYATDAQVSYLRRLLDIAFAAGHAHGMRLDRHHLDRVTRSEASAAIAALIAALAPKPITRA
jgi:hypothetical protein